MQWNDKDSALWDVMMHVIYGTLALCAYLTQDVGALDGPTYFSKGRRIEKHLRHGSPFAAAFSGQSYAKAG